MGKSKRREEGQYVPIPYAQLKSPAWRSLSGAAVKLWLELHTRFNGGNNGRLRLSYAEASEALGMGKATVKRAYGELVSHGFLVLEKEGNFYHRLAHEWRLTTKGVQGVLANKLPSHDWRVFKVAGKTKGGSETEPSGVRVVSFQNRKGVVGSKPEPVRRKNG
jgi:hypothetical protein